MSGEIVEVVKKAKLPREVLRKVGGLSEKGRCAVWFWRAARDM